MRYLALLLTPLFLLACNTDTGTGTTGDGGVSATSGMDMGAAGDPVVANYDGVEIRLSELDLEAKPAIIKAQMEIDRARHGFLEKMIFEALTEKEATATGMEIEAWLKAEVDDKLAPITDEDAKAFFDENPPRGAATFESMKPRVIAYMERLRKTERTAELTEELKTKYNVTITLEPFRIEVGADDDPFKGPADAPVTIVEFADFQCGFCGRTRSTTDEVLEAYPDHVKFVYRDFPIDKHPRAHFMAQAANCAGDQDKYWEMYNHLFDNPRGTSDDDMKSNAEALGLDTAAFNECYDGKKYEAEVDKDMDDGAAAGVSGTPAFFVNGRMISGAQPLEAFAAIIDDELKRAGIEVTTAQ